MVVREGGSVVTGGARRKWLGQRQRIFPVSTALAQAHEGEACLQALTAGGHDIPLMRAFWKDLKAEAMDLARKHQGRNKLR